MRESSRKLKIGYAIIAIPAVFLPISYVLMALWVCIKIIPGLIAGESLSVELPDTLRLIIMAGFYGTLIQCPFYLLWVGLSKELTLRIKLLWGVFFILFNMFAIPWFLYCKYNGTAQTELTKNSQYKFIKQFFQKGTNN